MTFQLRRKRPITAPNTRPTAEPVRKTVSAVPWLAAGALTSLAWVFGLASIAWFAGAVVPVAADEMILNNWTARRGSATVRLRPAASPVGNGDESLSAAASQSSTSANAVSKTSTLPAAEGNLRWHTRGSASGEEPAEPDLEETPDGFPIKLTAALEPISALEPIPAARMPHLAPVKRRGDHADSDRKSRDHTRSQFLTIAAENGDPLKDPFADEELQPIRSRLRKPAAEATPAQQPRPLQNDLFSDPAIPATPSGIDESPDMKLPSPSDLPPPPPSSILTPEPPKEASSPCDTDKNECRAALDRLKAHGIDTIALTIRINGAEGADFPCECTLGNDPFIWRKWAATQYTFKAAGTCHKPLYFEDVQLERYGHTWNPALQSILSGAHFFANVILLPYNMGVSPPSECVYSLGYYRPGGCAPYVIEPFPISVRGAAFEAGAIATGMWILTLY